MGDEMTDIRDILKEILTELRLKNNNNKNPNDLLTAKQIAEEYHMNYVTVLNQFKDKSLRVFKETKEYRVFRKDYEEYLRNKGD